MIYRTAGGGRRELRMPSELGSSAIPSWTEVSGAASYSGAWVNVADVAGIPAFSNAIELIAQTIGSLPLTVYRGRLADKRLADDTWQWELLHEQPCADMCVPLDLVSDIAACVEVSGNAFVQKIKNKRRRLSERRVIALRVIDPGIVKVDKDDNGTKIFRIRARAGADGEEVLGTNDMIHFRGFTLNGRMSGYSTVFRYRHKLGQMLAITEWEGRFFSNGMRPPGVVEVPEDLTPLQQQELRRQYESQYAGLQNQHRPVVLVNGAKWQTTGMSLADAQFVEGQKWSTTEVAQMFRLPPSFLGLVEKEKDELPEHALMRLTFALLPRITRIQQVFNNDIDLFPDRDPYCEFDREPLLAVDAKTKADVDHKRIQTGTELPDEQRAEEGKPPLPPIPDDPTQKPGSVPTLTPVGAAPNPPAKTEDE